MELARLNPPIALKRGTYLGECYQDKEYVGDLHRAEGGYRVLRVEYGKVFAQSEILPGSMFYRNGSFRLSASQWVNRYAIK